MTNPKEGISSEDKTAILNFFNAVENLKQTKIIRSSKYLGDIAEYLVAKHFNVKLCENQTQEGIDGILTEGKEEIEVQIKAHNGVNSLNVNVGNPGSYKILYLVIGPDSCLRKGGHNANEFRVYRFNNNEVSEWRTKKAKYSCGKRRIEKCSNEEIIALTELLELQEQFEKIAV